MYDEDRKVDEMGDELRSRHAPEAGHGDNWRDRAACLSVDPELFFPVGNTGPALAQIEKAKAVCARCDVTEICLRYALEHNENIGVWGGLSEDERRAIKRRQIRQRQGAKLGGSAINSSTRV